MRRARRLSARRWQALKEESDAKLGNPKVPDLWQDRAHHDQMHQLRIARLFEKWLYEFGARPEPLRCV